MADYVNPYINEHAPDLAWTKQYAERVKTDSEGFNSTEERELYNRIKSVISDEVGIGSFGASMVSDPSLREAVPIAGYHYNTDDDSAGNFKNSQNNMILRSGTVRRSLPSVIPLSVLTTI